MSIKNERGQSTLEYAVIVAAVIGALLALQVYLKRGVEGKLHESTDQIGEQFDAGNTSVDSTTKRTAKTVQTVNLGVTTSDTGGTFGGGGVSEVRNESGNEKVNTW
jgi:Flp pilus assembly pilin Flp